ncbi:hypothetical protein BCR42DRAFT_456157 [Absidia repens]|uniref:Heterokaryon incompatibility domain-containing protein n=1 Tax=Absidia repens TaxID=90262 RepID=A0A1X2I1K5_9FUNG|nr:hypothetical protein BCR42DRAFT_456157 [Absidia repens]
MTMNDNENHHSSSSSNENCETDKYLDLILIDIKRAAKEHKIHCVKKSLNDKDLKYVAITYRRGEVKPVTIDTQCGYTATITGFALDDFYNLCNKMTKETDLKDIDYVWVDAICVDRSNSNGEEEQYYYEMTTLQQSMISSIYDQAQFIVAVPDLFLTYLKCNPVNEMILSYCTKELSLYIYHLLHGNRQQLVELDAHWLASCVKSGHSNHSTTATAAAAAAAHDLTRQQQQKISERKESILRVVQFLTDLMVNWSSRVWKINIYQMAKRQQQQQHREKLKYWFIQLEKCTFTVNGECGNDNNCMLTFFQFFFNDFNPSVSTSSIDHKDEKGTDLTTLSMTLYQDFQRKIDHQLNQQTFFDMMLRSKTSLNKNRFKAILPLSDYKHLQANVDDWHITSLTSVKLKLFEFMHTKDKLDLLYLSKPSPCQSFAMLPTFATLFYCSSSSPRMPQQQQQQQQQSLNFDVAASHDVIQYLPPSNDGADVRHQLKLHPKAYYTCASTAAYQETINEYKTIYQGVVCDDAQQQQHSIVCIPRYTRAWMKANFDLHDPMPYGMQLFLLGDFISNRWICIEPLTKRSVAQDPDWIHHHTEDELTVSPFILY